MANRLRGLSLGSKAGELAISLSILSIVSSCLLFRPRCPDCESGIDRTRKGASFLELGVVNNDAVSWPEGDKTDWQYVELERNGELKVRLRWDSSDSDLGLALFDALGQRMQIGEPLQEEGLVVVAPNLERGRYYVQVAARGKTDESDYALQARFTPSAPSRCHNCVVGEKICLKNDGYAVCARTPEGCNAWAQTFACANDLRCQGGDCVPGCSNQCKPEARRCASETAWEVCVENAEGCFEWGRQRKCKRSGRCRSAGKCTRPQKRKPMVRVRIMKILPTRDGRELLFQIDGRHDIKVGVAGYVVEGDSDRPVPRGSFTISEVKPPYFLAPTSLRSLGKNNFALLKLN